MDFKSGGRVPFKKFSEEEHETWKILCERQFKNLDGVATKLHRQGWEALGMSAERIPDFEELNKRLWDLAGWQIEMTDIVYEDNIQWIGALRDKKFRITNFIRDKKDLDYTPLPDVFHDVFGHMPFLGIPQYAKILEKFGTAISAPENKHIQERISRLGWYGYEFGLMKEDGKIKAFGTGLMSSPGELESAFSDAVLRVPYKGTDVAETEISPHKYHEKLFILESLDHLEQELDNLPAHYSQSVTSAIPSVA